MIAMLMGRTRLANNALFNNIFGTLLFATTFIPKYSNQEANPSIEIFQFLKRKLLVVSSSNKRSRHRCVLG